ncbi:MAG: DNA repair protein RecN [Acidimicrobiales bacterium]|jgi:DNA repair protein RecN (Recombination protein N)
MLVELRVRDLGVIADLDLVIGPGMTALTGETGAGKTLVVEALELLLGGRADATMVRADASEAAVEGRFVVGEREVVLSRALPTTGRSRAYVDGRMAAVSLLSEIGDELVDLHGQHVHQSLLRQAAQREALDAFAGADLEPVAQARRELAAIDARLNDLGGDPRALARTVDLLRFQVDEIAKAAITAPDEDEQLAAEESVLAHIGTLRSAIAGAREALAGSDASQSQNGLGAGDLLGRAVSQLSAHAALSELAVPLRSAQADVEDVARELRLRDERLEEDPERLEAVRRRLQLFSELRRKYGPSLADVLEFERANRAQLAELEATEETRTVLEARRVATTALLREAEERLGAERREAAPKLAAAIEAHLQELALAGARFEVRIGDDPAGSEMEFLLGANPGEPALPLAKVASGGELSRAMLATRLVLSAAPPTLVFDEVDAGVGGEAALAVGRALGALGRDHQVLVVTHLAQVAAFADQQILVSKNESEGRTVARARTVTGEDRVVELSRMLSGHPDSAAARRHAKELLALGARSDMGSGGSGSLE